MGKFLSDAQIAQFQRDGYLGPFRAVTEAHAREFRNRVEGLEERMGQESEAVFKIKAHVASPWMTDLARHPVIVDAIEDLIGPDILMVGSSFFAKNARDPRFVSWHQDGAYFGIEPEELVTAWFAFTPSNRESGCLKVMPGSHLGDALPHEERMSAENMLARGQTIVGIDESKAVELIVAPGEFTLHHVKTAHGSGPNTSDDRRIGLAFFYMPTHVRSSAGRRNALLIRGEDRFGHWDADPLPRFDLDPVCLEELDRVWGRYKKAAYKRSDAAE